MVRCADYAICLHRAGRQEEAHEAAMHATRLEETLSGLYELAVYYSVAGRRDEAIRALARSLELGSIPYWMETDEDLASLHGDPRFEAMVENVRRLHERGAE